MSKQEIPYSGLRNPETMKQNTESLLKGDSENL